MSGTIAVRDDAESSANANGAEGCLAAADGLYGSSFREILAFFSSLQRQLTRPGLEWLFVFFVFFLQGAWPVPDVNEPYYVGKAIHFWNPSFGPRDDFFASRDAHWVFYFTAGWLSLFLPPAVTAWIIRLVTWTALTEGWRRLHRAVVGTGGLCTIWTATMFVAANDHFHLAGEWVIGGAEAKGLAYAALFFALAALARGDYPRTWLLLGIATAFHVLVGGWSMIATGFVWLLSGQERLPLRRMIPYIFAAVVIALPGLVPSLMLTAGVSPQIEAQAHRIYVFHRLCHHMVVGCFAAWNVARFAALTAVFIILCRQISSHARWLRVRNFVLGALLLACVGILLSMTVQIWPVFAASVLRYYWFRLADAAVPMGTALGMALLVQSPPSFGLERGFACRYLRRGLLGVGILGAAGHLMGYALIRAVPVVPRTEWVAGTWRASVADPSLLRNYYGWRRVCKWIAENTPPDARFLTPRWNGSFKWYTGRSEVVTWKEIPQDAESIVQWWHRLLDIYVVDDPILGKRWIGTLAELREKRLLELAAKYNVDYIVTTWSPTLDLELAFGECGNPYLVYRARRGQPPEASARGAVPSGAGLFQP